MSYASSCLLQPTEHELLVGVAGLPKRVPVESEVPKLGMADSLRTELPAGDVTIGPPTAELRAHDGISPTNCCAGHVFNGGAGAEPEKEITCGV